MDISGTMRIYKNEYEGRASYSTTISKKDQFGNYENMYISVSLPKDTNLESNTKINVTKGFLSFYKTNQGLPKIKAVVQEFEPEITETTTLYADNGVPIVQSTQNYYDSQANYYNDSLPF